MCSPKYMYYNLVSICWGLYMEVCRRANDKIVLSNNKILQWNNIVNHRFYDKL